MLKFVRRYVYWVDTIFSNRAILVQKLGEEKKMSKSVSGYLKTKKRIEKNVTMAIKPWGGGSKALIKRRTLFLRLP